MLDGPGDAGLLRLVPHVKVVVFGRLPLQDIMREGKGEGVVKRMVVRVTADPFFRNPLRVPKSSRFVEPKNSDRRARPLG
jgi:hypothetical protein